MKKLYTLLYISMVAMMALSSCDEVDPEDRLVYVEPAEAKRAILIEDFTGQKCVNCPRATDAIAELQATYGEDKVIAVGIHSGPFGRSTLLYTEQGDEYYTHWNVESQPGMLINRAYGRVFYDTSVLSYFASVYLGTETPLNLEASTTFDADTRVLSIDVTGYTSDPVDGKLQVYITEDGIIASQLLEDGSENTAYEHNHVFRASVTNDAYGDAFSLGLGESRTVSYSYTVPSDWNADNLAVVAFVYDDDEVVQAVRKPLSEASADEPTEQE